MRPVPWGDVIGRAILAGVFFYIFQAAILNASPETSLVWSIVMAIAAAVLAWSQSQRG